VNTNECFREPDVVEAVRSGEWPGRSEPGLREHVASCAVCTDVLAVALAFQEDAEAADVPHLPTAAHVWWRAGIRSRQDAAHAAERPMTIVESVAAASGVGLAAAAIAMGWSVVSPGLKDIGALPMFAMAAGGVAAVVLVPIALYFALAEPKG
jgi:hypothetical protein